MRLTGNSGGTDASTLAYLADGLGSVQTAAGNMVTGGPVAATGVTPTNSYNEASYPSAKTIDGNTTGSTGFWAGTANTTTPSTLTLELGSSQTLSRVKLHRVASYLADYTVKAADVQLRQADNSWLTVGTLAGNTTADSPEIAFTPAAGSAVRVIFKGARAGALVLVAEVTLQLDSGPSSLSTQRFDAWGNLIQATGSIPAYGYTGREPDQSGLTYYRARYYHPGLGRFISRDPIGLQGGINPYAYASGNPVNFNDPSGLIANKVGNYAQFYTGKAVDTFSSVGTDVKQGLGNWWGASVGGFQSESATDFIGRSLQAFPVEAGVVGIAGVVGNTAVKTEQASSRVLGAALENAGFVREVGDAAHHIVASGAKAATEARDILQNFGVGINDAANGVFLPATKALAEAGNAAAHAVVHTKEYYDSVTTALLQATSKKEVIDVLSQIRARLLNGGKP